MNAPTIPDTNPLNIRVSKIAKAAWIEICGEVDISNCAALHDALFALDFAEADPIYLGLRQLTFCDSNGCDLFLRFEREARRLGHEARFVDVRPIVRRVFDILGADRRLTFV
ncbi:MAG: STAS domain-containing protein [Nocardioidaceae bacterium]